MMKILWLKNNEILWISWWRFENKKAVEDVMEQIDKNYQVLGMRECSAKSSHRTHGWVEWEYLSSCLKQRWTQDWREANVVLLCIADSWGHVGKYRLDISGHPEARDVDEIQYK